MHDTLTRSARAKRRRDRSAPKSELPTVAEPAGVRAKVLLGAALLIALAAGGIAIWMSIRFADFLETPFDLAIFPAMFLAYDRLPLLIIALATGVLLLVPLRFLAACALPARWVDYLAARPLIPAGVVSALLCLGAIFVYHSHPLSADEFAAVFQSKIFAAGHIFGQFPPKLAPRLMFPDFVNYFFVVSMATGAVASNYWPGFALLLTPFTAAHVSWACNPVLAGLSLWLLCRLAGQLRNERSAGGWAMLLAISSPAFVVNAISYYSMPAHLCLNLLFVYLLIQGTWKKTALAGVVGSFALALHNPVPHLAFATPWFVWSLWRQHGLRKTLLLAAAYLPLAIPLVGGWAAVRALVPLEKPTVAQTVAGPAPAPTTEPAPKTSVRHSDVGEKIASFRETLLSPFNLPTKGILEVRAVELAKLVAWNVPALLALAGLGLWRFRKDGRALALAASAFTTVGVYFLVHFDQGHGWGDRYFHSAWGVLPVLGALAIPRSGELELSARALRGSAFVLSLLSLLILLPMRLYQVNEFMERDLAQIPPHDPNVSAVVFIDPEGGYYAQDLIQNDPFLRDPVVYMFSNGVRADAALIRAAFPGFVGRLYDSGSVWTARGAAVEAAPNRPPGG